MGEPNPTTSSTSRSRSPRKRRRDGPPPLILSPGIRDGLEWLAARGYPHEVCGLLVGERTDAGFEITRVTQARNLAVERRADRYTLDPASYLAADSLAREDGLQVLGVWHTHPDHPARPSQTDLEAAWEGFCYLILSVSEWDVEAVTSWRLAPGGARFVEQPIEEKRP